MTRPLAITARMAREFRMSSRGLASFLSLKGHRAGGLTPLCHDIAADSFSPRSDPDPSEGGAMKGGYGRRGGVATWLALLLVVGCDSGTAGPEVSGVCIAGLQFGGLFYAKDGSLPAGLHAGEPVGTVVRSVGCHDTPGSGDPEDTVLLDGDANFLPVGTVIRRVESRAVEEVLTVQFQDEWVQLIAENDTSQPTG